EDAGAVGAGLSPEDAVVVAVGPDVVELRRLVEAADELDGLVDKVDQMRECVAEEPADPQRDVDAGPAELGEGDGLHARDPARLLGPDRAGAEEGESFGDVVAVGAHGGGAPHDEPDGRRPGTGLGPVAGTDGL